MNTVANALAHDVVDASASPGPGPASVPASTAERPLLIACEGERLLGILHPAAGSTGVIVIVGGPQYRAGSHRHFVELARTLAAAGHPVLRFDVRGMGDSSGALHDFEHIAADVGAAVDALQAEQPQLRRIALWGLCDGASAALLYLHERPDPRVAGLALLNPWVRSAQSLARTHVKHYYRQRLMQKAFWLKLLRGGVATPALRGLLANLHASAAAPAISAGSTASYQQRMATAWHAFPEPILLALSDQDYTAAEFLEFTRADSAWSGLLSQPRVQRQALESADHTLSTAAARAEMERRLLEWLARL